MTSEEFGTLSYAGEEAADTGVVRHQEGVPVGVRRVPVAEAARIYDHVARNWREATRILNAMNGTHFTADGVQAAMRRYHECTCTGAGKEGDRCERRMLR